MTPRPPRILVADDHPDLRALLTQALEGAGYAVAAVADGQEALDAVRAAPPDLLILDLSMPVKTGFEVTEELKRDPLLRHLPVILLTSEGELRSKVKGLDLGADDYVTKPVEIQEFLARIRMVMRRTRLGLEANPLTRLPGNPAIAERLEQAVGSGAPFAVLYVDLNQFKAYNDVYGYDAGDRVIRRTAEILMAALKREGAASDFLGHIGGDDFILATAPERSEALCAAIVEAFDAEAPKFYTEADRARGSIQTRDRRGNLQEFPLLSISIGVATNVHRSLKSVGQISQIGSELKRYAKTFKGSKFVFDRRTE